MAKTKIWILVLFSALSIQFTQAQCPTIFIDDMNGIPGYAELNDLSVCGAQDTLTLYFLNSAGQSLLNSQFTLNLPAGFEFGGYLNPSDPNVPVTVGSAADPQNPVFLFPSLDADQTQILEIGIVASCDVFDNPSNMVYELEGTFDFLFTDSNGAIVPCTTDWGGDVDYVTVMKTPTINITNMWPGSDVVIDSFSPKCQWVRVTQTGLGASVTGYFFDVFGIDFANFSISSVEVEVGSGGPQVPVSYTTDTANGSISMYVDDTYFPNGFLGEDEHSWVEICFNAPLECDTDQTPIDLLYAASFGCGAGGACAAPSNSEGTLAFAPNFNANPIVNVTQVQGPGVCGNNAIFDVTVTSAQTDPDLGLWEELEVGFQICEADAFEPADVKINGVSIDPSTYYYSGFDFVVDTKMFTSDPDGPGGLTDVDGDGAFDDLPGGETLSLQIEAAVKCQDPQQIAGCAAIDCTFEQATISGLRHCSTPFQALPAISPAPQFSYGADSITTTETDIDPGPGVIEGYDFGTGVDNQVNTIDMEFCYNFGADGVDPCVNGDTYFEVAIAGPPILTADIAYTAGTAMFNGAAIPASDISVYYPQPDSSEVVFRFLAGSNDLVNDQCYNFSLEIDSCVCYPQQYAIASMRVVEDCADCTDGCTIVRACTEAFIGSDRSCSCVCPLAGTISEMRRLDYGYTDKTKTTKVQYDDPGVAADWNRYLPCDTMLMHVEWTVNDPLALESWHEIRLRVYDYAFGGYPEIVHSDATLDYHNGVIKEFSFSKASDPAGTRVEVDYTGTTCADGGGALSRNMNDDYLVARGFTDNETWPGTFRFDGYDVFDNTRTYVHLYDYESRHYEGGGPLGVGDCWTHLLDTQMGGVEVGDKLHMILHVPVQKNPFYQLVPGADAQPDTEQAAYPSAYWYSYIGGTNTYIGASCVTAHPYETKCAGPVDSYTNYIIDDCSATVEHVFKINQIGDGWYQNEYRPALEWDRMDVPLPSPLVYAGNAEVELPDGTIVPLTDPIWDGNEVTAFDGTQTFATSGSMTTYGSFDVSQLGQLGVGLQSADPDSIIIRYDLLKLCPGNVDSPADFELFYDYSSLCDYHPGGYIGTGSAYPNGLTQYSFFFDDQTEYLPFYSGTATNAAGELFSDRDYHIRQDTSYTLNFTDNSNSLPSLSSTVTSILLSDAAGMSEFNTYQVCAGTGSVPHTNVITTIKTPPTVDLLGVADLAGAAVTYTLTGSDLTGNTYLIEMADLAPGACHDIVVETELKFCPVPGMHTETCIKTTSMCMDPTIGSQLFGSGGDACTATDSCYEYVAGEAEIQNSWVNPYPDPVDLCTPQTFEVVIKNTKEAVLTNLEYEFTIPPGLNVVAGSWEWDWPHGGGNWQPLTDPTNTGPVTGGDLHVGDDDDIAYFVANGFPGIFSGPDSNRLSIRFVAETECDNYVSNTPLLLNSRANDPCEGTQEAGPALNDGLVINGADPDDHAQFLVVAAPPNYSCGGAVPVTISGLNLSQTGGVTDQTVACFTFDSTQLAYTPGSANFLSPAGWTSTITETAIAGTTLTEVCFTLPDGIQPQQSFAVEATLTPDPDAGCGEMIIGSSITSPVEGIVCQETGVACTVHVNNGINNEFVINITSPVGIDDVELIVACDEDPTVVTYDYNITLEGLGMNNYVGNIDLNFYQDLNGNGLLDPGVDPLLATQSGTTTVPSGGTTDYTGSVDLEEVKSCPILIDAVFDVPCECKSNVFYFDEPPLPDFLDLDGPISLCPGDDLTLSVCGGYQFALNPSIGGTITNSGGVLTVDLADGFGISNPVILEVTTGHAQCPGSFELEIFQMETFEIGPFSQLDACDSECTVLDLNLPSDWANMDIVWSPATGLDDPTSDAPELCNPTASTIYTVTVTNPNSGCVTSADFPVNVIDTTPPTIELDGWEDCFLPYDPSQLVALPAGAVNYEFYYISASGDILLQSGPSNAFTLPFAEGDFYVIVDDGECAVPSAPITLDIPTCIFDLALTKVLSPGQVTPVYAGDDVVFNIDVTNQGTINAVDIEVTDYIPAGFVLNDPQWFSVAANEVNRTIAGPLLPGQTVTISITLKVMPSATAGTLTNFAEISSADDEDGNGYPDIDSTPDDDNSNDGPVTDDDTSSSNGDEDDHDPADVPVAIFDLALTKIISPSQPMPVTIGDNVTYDIEICNQGTVDAFNIEVVDYLPTGMSLNDPSWTMGAGNEAFYTHAGPLAANTCVTIQIICQIDLIPASGSFTNTAEISEAEDANGNNPPDIDSTPDDDPSNDGPADDGTTDNSNGDEDDSDPAVLSVSCPDPCITNFGEFTIIKN